MEQLPIHMRLLALFSLSLSRGVGRLTYTKARMMYAAKNESNHWFFGIVSGSDSD